MPAPADEPPARRPSPVSEPPARRPSPVSEPPARQASPAEESRPGEESNTAPRATNAIRAISDLQILRTSELNVPLGRVSLGGLRPHERREIVAWNAHTVGEVLFKFWD